MTDKVMNDEFYEDYYEEDEQLNEIDAELYEDYYEEAAKLTERLAVIDPDLFRNLSIEWIETIIIKPNGEHQNNLNSVVKDYKAFSERAFLISKRKQYVLFNSIARIMLSKGTNHFESLGVFPLESFRTRNIDKAYELIVDMHQEWLDKEDLSLFIPRSLESDKKQIINSYLQTISSLNLEDESEGTLAYILHDYCRTMIVYNCMLQFADGNDLKTIILEYGDHAANALILYNALINNLEGGNEIEIVCNRRVYSNPLSV